MMYHDGIRAAAEYGIADEVKGTSHAVRNLPCGDVNTV